MFHAACKKYQNNLDIKFTLPHAPGPNKKGAIGIYVKCNKDDFPHPVFTRLGMYNFICDYFIANVFFCVPSSYCVLQALA